MVPAWVMIIGWAYLEPLVLTRTDNWASAMKLQKLNFIVFFSQQKISQNFGKFSQEMEYARAKWTRYGGHMAKAKGEHNS